MNDKKSSIDINNIVSKSVLSNKVLIIAIIPLFIGFYLQDTIFTRSVADITKDIPKFTETADINKILLVLIPFIMAIIIFYLTNIITSDNMTKLEMDVTQEITDKVIESIKTSKNKVNVNELMTQIKKVSDTKNIYKVFTAYIIPTVVVIISLIYNFMKADSKSGFIVAIIIIILVLVTMKLEYDSIRSAFEAEQSVNELYDGIHETMVNIDSVITSDTKSKELSNINNYKNKTYEMTYKSEVKNGNTTYGLQILTLFSVICINFIAYKMYKNNKISDTVLVTIVLLTLLFMDYYNYCVSSVKEIITNVGKLYDANEYFSKFEIKDNSNRKNILKIKNGTIDLKNINLMYGNKTIFDNLKINLKGNTIGIIGPIGCGKSTILKMIAGIIEYEGEILIDGQNIKESSYESVSKNIAYIPQHPKLFNKSILYNISYGNISNDSNNSNNSNKEIKKRLDELNLTEFINVFPDKLNTVVGKEGSNVSGGQRQFISFIRAILQDKKIILLDEPSSSLDNKSKQVLMDVIKKLKDRKIIIVTHDKELYPIFDEIINIKNI